MNIEKQTPWTSYDNQGNELKNGSYCEAWVRFADGKLHRYELRSDGKETKVLGYLDTKHANESGAIALLTGSNYQPLPN